MKKIITAILFLAIACASYSQQRITKKEIDQFNKNLKDFPLLLDDPDFKSNSMGEKWSNESAVILCQKASFDFDRKGMSAGKRIGRNIWGFIFALPTLGTSLYFANATSETKILIEETERRKILLRDKFAVDQYSVLYFRSSSEGDVFSARVIKKNGDVQPIDISEAVRVEDVKSVPDIFRSYTDAKFTISYRPDYFKVPISDLEEGDIIEYEFRNFNTQSYSKSPNYKEFDPVYYVCNREMPVARQIIEVVTEDDKYYIGYKSLRGAPDFAETTNKGKKVYRWVDDNRDKLEDTRYVNEFVEQPSIKFQVIYARNSSKDFVWFNNKNDAKQDMSPEELAENIKKYWFNRTKYENQDGSYIMGSLDDAINSIYKSLKKKGITEGTDDDYIRKAYYSIRAQTLYKNWRDMAFAKIFSGLLDKKKIQHEIIATTSNQRTQLDKVAFTGEIAWIVKCKGKYYCNPYEHLNPEDIPVYLAGNACVRFDYNDEKKFASDVVPASDTADNVIGTQIAATLDSAGNIAITKTVEAKGLLKDDIIDDILAYTPFMETDFRNFDGTGMWEGMNDVEMGKATEQFNKQKQEWKEEKPKMMKEMAEDQYDAKVEKYGTFKVQTDGRSYKKKTLKYNEDFTLSGLTAVAGPDQVVALPALIGGQPKITKEERSRTLPIDLRYPRKMLWHIVLDIPSGYTVKGIENLNRRLDNMTGSFITTAAVDGSKLVIDVRKIYKEKHFEASQWPQLLLIMDEAYNFSQAKVILKKN